MKMCVIDKLFDARNLRVRSTFGTAAYVRSMIKLC